MNSERKHSSRARSADASAIDHHGGHPHRRAPDEEREDTSVRRRPLDGDARSLYDVDGRAADSDGYAQHRYEPMEHEYVSWSLYESDDPRAFHGEHAPYAAWGSHGDLPGGASADERARREVSDPSNGAPAWGTSTREPSSTQSADARCPSHGSGIARQQVGKRTLEAGD